MYRYLNNPFDTVTQNNNKRMLLMARDHRDKMKGFSTLDPDINQLFQELNPKFTAFEEGYSDLHSKEGIYKGHTQMLEELMQDLSSTQIKQWNIWVQNVFLDGTPEYTMLFPQGRKTFQNGAYELRVDAIRTLSLTLNNFAELSTVKQAVDLFLTKINTVRTNQQQMESMVQAARQNLEYQRLALANTMHRIFGFLVYKFYQNPVEVERFYELKYLQAPVAKEVVNENSIPLPANSRATVVEQSMTGNSFITVKNTGTATLKLFTTADKNALTPDIVKELLPNETFAFYGNELSDGTGYDWLIAVNETGQAGKIAIAREEVELE